MFMALYPDVQEEARAELDRVVGKDRLPEFSDRPNMPYLEAVLQETARCGLVFPLSLAHVSTEDDEYNGYLIPKGSIVTSNIW